MNVREKKNIKDNASNDRNRNCSQRKRELTYGQIAWCMIHFIGTLRLTNL